MINIKSKKEIELMQESCRITAMAHDAIKKLIKPGISTLELDRVAEKVITSNGAIPSFKNYPSFDKSVPNYPMTSCISINNEVIHGIPSKNTIINEGDIVSIDLRSIQKWISWRYGENDYYWRSRRQSKRTSRSN